MTNSPNGEFSADPPEIDPAELSLSITELRLRVTKMYEQAIARQQNRDCNDSEASYQQAERDRARMQQMIEKITQAKIVEMNTKELIIQELNQLPEALLPKVLESIRQLKNSEPENTKERIWQAYLESEQENEEVYQRLANS